MYFIQPFSTIDYSSSNTHLHLLITCIIQQSKICGNSAQQGDLGSTLIQTKITIWVHRDMPKNTTHFQPFSHLFHFISVLSHLANALCAHCMTCLKIQTNFVSLAKDNYILTDPFLNDLLTWSIAYERLSKAQQFRFTFTTGQTWETIASQAKSTNTIFSHLAEAKFTNCITCVSTQRNLIQFQHTIAFSPFHICLSRHMSKYISLQFFILLPFLHPSVLSKVQQSDPTIHFQLPGQHTIC